MASYRHDFKQLEFDVAALSGTPKLLGPIDTDLPSRGYQHVSFWMQGLHCDSWTARQRTM